MQKVNINRRDSVENFYPRSAFEEDARRNSEAKTTVHHGVRILSAPDAQGDFSITRAHQHVGEDAPDQDTVFLTPFMGEDYDRFMQSETDYGRPVPKEGHPDRDASAYSDFIDGILDAARKAHFPDPIGQGEERLKGFHGG